MSANLTAIAYLIASVCFIFALRGLSNPETARQGNMLGIAGMAIAVFATLLKPGMGGFHWILLAVAIGGGAGAYIATRIQMTALPQLVAAFHSLVGLAAVFVAAAALYSPQSFGLGMPGTMKAASLVEMSLGLAIGAITFSGSVIAFAKLQGIMSGAPITFPRQHLLNAVLGAVLVLLVIVFVSTESRAVFWMIALLSFAIGFLIILPIGGADMPVVVSMLNSYSGWAACGIGFTVGNL
ncbi:MAG: NAD(P)(+) transhydrogenase (Re/Si-specific) subunit beta, partial [Acetobacteraceae bacterium]|nr:NAD(P)(+) transhydrogenase (Re/Si-specific) subunit beta [Acetobacteraceae bacterium]